MTSTVVKYYTCQKKEEYTDYRYVLSQMAALGSLESVNIKEVQSWDISAGYTVVVPNIFSDL